ncbi:Type II secretory pathway, pseudopilin PulG [Bibersteinia trehalosi]|uniref:Type II secretory pathway, pseudopilin PulG n=1 Tax=Bibersteinia trehalosi TaxID=47735 RepID=UPI004045F5F5
MYRAITLLETLITLAIIVIASYFISPVLFSFQDQLLVENEIENVKSFLYQLQDKARYQNRNYALNIAQNSQHWCIIAIAKNSGKSTACDCLNLKSCQLLGLDYHLYKNHNNVSIYNKNTYPKILTYFDGRSGNQSTICLSISKGKNQAILQIQRNGVINVILDTKSRSQCKEN